MTYSESGKTAEAFQAYTDGLKRSDVTQGAAKLRAEMLTRVGNLYLRKNQYGEARRFFRAALTSAISMQDRLAEGYLFIQLGHCEIRESKEAGIKDYQLALESFTGLGYPPGSAYALVSLALAAQRSDRLPDALSYFKAALEHVDGSIWLPPRDDLFHECEQAFYESNQISPYDGIIDLLLQLGRFDEAFWYVERKQGRALFDILASLDLRTRDETMNGFLRKFQHARSLRIGAERQLAQTLAENAQARELISDIHIQLDRSAREMQETSERIVEMNGALRQAVSISNFGLAEVQKLLPQGTALIEHVPGRRAAFTLMITNSKLMSGVAALEKEKVLGMAREFSDLLLQRQRFADSSATKVGALDRRREELGAALYSALVRPVEGNLSTIKKLVVVPQPEWGALPLHALRKSPSRPYLGEQCLVTYLPSSLALQLPQFPSPGEGRASTAQTGSARDIVGLGHAGQSAWDVEYELKDIRAFYKDARLYFNQQANLSTLQHEHGDVLHLAVEVHIDEQRPGNSSFVLSDGRSGMTRVPWGQLGTLPAFPFVIVSDLSGHRPVMAPAEAYLFLLSGTRTVVLSAYTPTRKAKKFFGEQLYTALLAGSPAEEGYRQAQLEMIRNSDYTSPHVWAPFFLWGR
jgi:CHAT domain-containing protein